MRETKNKLPYGYLRAWGALLNSRSYYVREQVQQATYEKAPEDAIFRRDDGSWAEFDHITSAVTRSDVERIGLERGYLEHA